MSRFTKIKLIGPVLGIVLMMPMSGVALADDFTGPDPSRPHCVKNGMKCTQGAKNPCCWPNKNSCKGLTMKVGAKGRCSM